MPYFYRIKYYQNLNQKLGPTSYTLSEIDWKMAKENIRMKTNKTGG